MRVTSGFPTTSKRRRRLPPVPMKSKRNIGYRPAKIAQQRNRSHNWPRKRPRRPLKGAWRTRTRRFPKRLVQPRRKSLRRQQDRKSVVWGKGVAVRVNMGGGGAFKNKN